MRRYLSLLLLSFGILLVFSRSSCHKNLSSTNVGNWTGAAPIPNNPRGYASSFVIGTKAYVGMGMNSSLGNPVLLNDFFSFDANTGWTQVQTLPGPARQSAVAFSVDNYGYAGTGLDANQNPLKDFYQYDPVANKWQNRDSFPGGPRWDAVGFGVQHLGYIGTGFNINWMNDFWQYDPAVDKWSPTPGTAGEFAKRRAAVSFVYKNQAYVVAGSNSAGMVSDFWSFDPSRATPWKRLGNIAPTGTGIADGQYTDIRREYAIAFVNGNTAYLTSGRNGTSLTSTWAYDFVQDVWTRRTPYPRSPRFGMVGFTIGTASFAGTGFDGNRGTYDDFLQFQPDQPWDPNSLTN